jgi:hypothetical protein
MDLQTTFKAAWTAHQVTPQKLEKPIDPEFLADQLFLALHKGKHQGGEAHVRALIEEALTQAEHDGWNRGWEAAIATRDKSNSVKKEGKK